MTEPARVAVDHAQPSPPFGGDAGSDLRSLLTFPLTWRIIGWWTLGYGLSSWIVEWIATGFGRHAARIPFWFGANRMVYATVWAGAIVVAIAITEWRPVSRLGQPGRIALHVAACFIMTYVWAVVAYYACVALVPGWSALGVGQMVSSTAKSVLFGYILITILVHILARLRWYRHQEIAALWQARLATEAQLQVLKMEMQPHFLFNALHSISSLIHSDPAAANETLVRLSDLLRYSMDTARVQQVSLREELESLRLYTHIERVRFDERLNISWCIAEGTLHAAVPHMLLQPLVENAIKHGLQARSISGCIEIAAERKWEWLWLTIRDDGPGPGAPVPSSGGGRGIGNTRARLRQLYGDRHTFALNGRPQGGSEVAISIPFEVVHGTLDDLVRGPDSIAPPHAAAS